MSQASVVIVGGGVIGAATACFLARDHGVAVTVLERDPTLPPGVERAVGELDPAAVLDADQHRAVAGRHRLPAPCRRRTRRRWRAARHRPGRGRLPLPGQRRRRRAPARQPGTAARAWRRHRSCSTSPRCARAGPGWRPTVLRSARTAPRGEGWFDGPALHAAFRRKARGLRRPLRARRRRGLREPRRSCARRCAMRRAGLTMPITLLIAAGAWSAPLAAALGLALPVQREEARRVRARLARAAARLPLAHRSLGRLVATRRSRLPRRCAAARRRHRRRAARRHRPRPVRRRHLAHAGRAHPGLRSAARAFGLGRLLRDEPLRPQRRGRRGAGLAQCLHRLRILGPRHAARAGRRPRAWPNASPPATMAVSTSRRWPPSACNAASPCVEHNVI